MPAYTVLWREPLWVKFFWIREMPGVPMYVKGRRKYVGSCWNNMTVSKIDFFDCLSDMHWNWREQSHSLFENLKHNTVNIDIIKLVGEKCV
jgi:hypothetical protein